MHERVASAPAPLGILARMSRRGRLPLVCCHPPRFFAAGNPDSRPIVYRTGLRCAAGSITKPLTMLVVAPGPSKSALRPTVNSRSRSPRAMRNRRIDGVTQNHRPLCRPHSRGVAQPRGEVRGVLAREHPEGVVGVQEVRGIETYGGQTREGAGRRVDTGIVVRDRPPLSAEEGDDVRSRFLAGPGSVGSAAHGSGRTWPDSGRSSHLWEHPLPLVVLHRGQGHPRSGGKFGYSHYPSYCIGAADRSAEEPSCETLRW